MNHNKMKPLILIFTILLLAASFMGCTGKYASSIVEIKNTQQDTGVVSTTVYSIVVSSGFDWSTAAEKDKKGLAKYAVQEALKQVEADSADSYTIIGIPEDSDDTLFIYDEENNIVKLVEDGEYSAEVKL